MGYAQNVLIYMKVARGKDTTGSLLRRCIARKFRLASKYCGKNTSDFVIN